MGDLQQLRNDLRAREHTIETLQEQINRLEADLERVERRTGGSGEPDETEAGAAAGQRADGRLTEQVESLQRDLTVRDATILDLRKQVHAFEEELGKARDELLAEVEKLKALTSGDLELKPSAELDEMESDELLDYAKDVAEDLDVRRQTLDEGLQGIESVKGSYEESKRVYQDQEKQMHDQLETLRSELDAYQQQQERDAATGSADAHDTIVQQRGQLDLLSTRIRQLVAGNQELNESNKKMYENLEQAVKRVIPLRKQIEELDSLNEALQRYIRQTHDRTFTTRKLAEAGVAP